MKIGIIGSGNIGRTVGKLWADAGHEVMFSSRHPDQLTELAAEAGANARVGTPDEAARFGEIILLAVNYKNNDAVIDSIGAHFAEKIIMDATNPVGFTLPDGETAGTLMAKKLPNATIIKVFNHVNFKVLQSEAHRSGDSLAIAVAGNEADAKATVMKLVSDAGFVGVDIGTLADSAPLDPGGALWTKSITADELRATVGL